MGRKSKSKSASNTEAVNKKAALQTKQQITSLTDQLLKICSQALPSSAKLWEEYIEIHSLLKTVTELENGVHFPSGKREEHFEEFIQWLREKGVAVDNVGIAHFSEGDWGLKAEKDIKDGELWLSVPREIMLSSLHPSSTRLAEILKTDPISKHMPQVFLALLVLEERLNPDSEWTAYFNILPSEYNTVLYFSPDELEFLKGSPCLEEALKQYRHIARQYAYYWQFLQRNHEARLLNLKDKFTFSGYRWAVSTVMTRQNAVPLPDGTEMLNALVPLWDMCNHTAGKLTTDFSLEKEALQCYAMQDYQKGDQIFIFYGKRPNSEFFIHNAFVDENNEFDSVAIKLGISKNDPLAEKKAVLLQQLQINPNDTFHLTKNQQPLTNELLAFIRVFAMEDGDLTAYLDTKNMETHCDLLSIDCVLSDALKLRSWKFLQVRLSLLLKAYPSTLQEDEALMSDCSPAISSKAQMALLLRICEKRVLHHALDFVNTQCN